MAVYKDSVVERPMTLAESILAEFDELRADLAEMYGVDESVAIEEVLGEPVDEDYDESADYDIDDYDAYDKQRKVRAFRAKRDAAPSIPKGAGSRSTSHDPYAYATRKFADTEAEKERDLKPHREYRKYFDTPRRRAWNEPEVRKVVQHKSPMSAAEHDAYVKSHPDVKDLMDKADNPDLKERTRFLRTLVDKESKHSNIRPENGVSAKNLKRRFDREKDLWHTIKDRKMKHAGERALSKRNTEFRKDLDAMDAKRDRLEDRLSTKAGKVADKEHSDKMIDLAVRHVHGELPDRNAARKAAADHVAAWGKDRSPEDFEKQIDKVRKRRDLERFGKKRKETGNLLKQSDSEDDDDLDLMESYILMEEALAEVYEGMFGVSIYSE